jgi:hypothetical protein
MLETPFSLASFIFYRGMRFVMRRLIVFNSRFNRRRAHQWHVLSAESLSMTLALPAVMTSGPRWNPHAIIAGAGPFSVKHSVSVDVEPIPASAKSWTLVFYTFPHQRTAAHVGALQAPFFERWHSVTLPPGKYSIALRYYHWSETITLPEIRADGELVIPSRSISAGNNDFYRDLQKRRSRFYLWLHYYVYGLLRGTAPIPGVSTEREFLPMGNPETEFRYGALERGEAIRFHLTPAFLATHDIYFTLYTRDSFPARWYQIQESGHLTEPAREDGFYLVRIQPRSLTKPEGADAAIDIRTVTSAAMKSA